MIYLHKSVFQSHGYLSSANCHVDSRWVLKVSGFALHTFRDNQDIEQVEKCFVATFIAEFVFLFLLNCETEFARSSGHSTTT